jgi:hypothetical protein
MQSPALDEFFPCLIDTDDPKIIFVLPLTPRDVDFFRALKMAVDYFPYQSADGLSQHAKYFKPGQSLERHINCLFRTFEQYQYRGYRLTWEQYAAALTFIHQDTLDCIPEAARVCLEEDICYAQYCDPKDLVSMKTVELLYQDLFPVQR